MTKYKSLVQPETTTVINSLCDACARPCEWYSRISPANRIPVSQCTTFTPHEDDAA